MVLKLSAWVGPSAVFGHPKYDACHEALLALEAGRTNGQSELVSLGWELKRAMASFDSALRAFLFDQSGAGWEPDKLRNPMRYDGGKELVDLFVSLQTNQAAALCGFTARVSEEAYSHVKGCGSKSHPPRLVSSDASTDTDVQPVPDVFKGMAFNGSVQFGELGPDAQARVSAAVELVLGHLPELTKEAIADAERDGGGLVGLIKGGRLGDAGDAVHVGPSDQGLQWLVNECSPSLGNGLVAPLPLLYAEMLLLSENFHRDMGLLLRPFGTYSAANMKGFLRAWAKCSDPDDGYGGDAYPRPESMHLKDVLRCTVLVKDHRTLVAAHRALLRKYRPGGTKDRRADAPRDVLQLVWYKGFLVEVQFHFASVAAIKKLSHVAYNIMRVNAEAGFGAGIETLYSLDNMWGGGAGVCTQDDLECKLQLD